MMTHERRGQEEILGFVAVVVVVVLVVVVVIGLTFPVQETADTDLQAFLESIGTVTTSCSLGGVRADIRHVLEACTDEKNCDSGVKSCDAARETLSGILNVSFRLLEGRALKGYVFKAVYERSGAKEAGASTELIEIARGNCSGNTRSANSLMAYAPGQIRTSLEFCS